MNVSAIHAILRKTCVQLRKGEAVEVTETPALTVTEVYAMPPSSDPAFADLVKVDMHFVVIGVDKAAAEAERDNLIALLDTWPEPERLASGPSYIEVGATIGDQGAAFELFALGKVLGIWGVITPGSFGFTGEHARQLAGSGFIMCTGYPKR